VQVLFQTLIWITMNFLVLGGGTSRRRSLRAELVQHIRLERIRTQRGHNFEGPA
jgi:hypothetical protein